MRFDRVAMEPVPVPAKRCGLGRSDVTGGHAGAWGVPIGILLSVPAALAACTPSPQEAVIDHAPSASATAPAPSAGSGASMDQRAAAGQAAQGPMVEPVSAAENPAPMPPEQVLSDEAQGRRILSTAFVRVGPDGHLTIGLRDGRSIVLRDVVMGPRKYCGMRPSGESQCGRYADIVAARPGGGALPAASDSSAPEPLPARR